MAVQSTTTEKRNTFFCHLTYRSSFPLRVKSPFSMILRAGNSCSGVDNKIANEYRNCTCHAIESSNINKSAIQVSLTAWTIFLRESRFTITTVWI